MKSFLLLLLITIVWTAEGQVAGAVTDTKGQEIPFANVLLLNAADSSMVKGGVTNMSGAFQFSGIDEGYYILEVNLLSYQKWHSGQFHFSSGETKNFGTITIEEETLMLEGVEIKADRLQVEQTIEGTTVNVQSTMAAKGSTALQILERSPGVVLDRRYNNLTLNGQSGTLIMINGRPVRMSSNEIINMLNGMSADNLESIELLTNPSAKYDADGGAGIINLKIKKSEHVGTNGSVSATSGYGMGLKHNVTLNLNHGGEKTNSYGSYSYNFDDTFSNFNAVGESTRDVLGGTQGFDFTGNPAAINHSHNGQLGFEWNANQSTIIGANALYNYGTVRSDILNEAIYFLPDATIMNSEINVKGTAPTHNFSATLFLDKKISDQSGVNVGFDYINYQNQSPTEVSSRYTDDLGEEIDPANERYVSGNRGSSTTGINVGVIKIDYNQRIGDKTSLEMGLKGSVSKTENSAYIDAFVDGDWQRDTRNVNKQFIDEKIGAAYTTLNFSLDSLTKITGGIRYETWLQEFSDIEDRQAGRFFPSVFITRTLANHRSLQVAYNRRITRPGYNDLTTFLRYNDPFSVFTGNSGLRPGITDNFKLGYQVKGKSFSLIYTYETNPIARYQLTTSSQNDLTLISPQNLGYLSSLGLQFHIPIDIAKWWSLSVGGTVGSRNFKLLHTPQTLEKRYLTANFYGNHDIKLPHDISLEISGFLNTSHYNGSARNDAFGMLNTGIRKVFKNNSSLQFTVTDLLKSMKINFHYGELTPEVWNSYADGLYKSESAHARIFKVTYFKSFGSNKIKGAKGKNRGSQEERNRIGQ